ncbi:MAG TPA: hypothetical protein VIQ30_22765 [Pseudonocardia sp.]
MHSDYYAETDDTGPSTPEEAEQDEAARLPAPLDLLGGPLDIDALDAATRGLGNRLTDAIGGHVKAVRGERQAVRDGDTSAVYTVGEVAPLVRDLAHGAEVLDRIAGEFAAAAKSAREFITDEALSTGADRVAVPDGDTEIVVAPVSKSTTWTKPDQLAPVVAGVLARGVDPDAFLESASGDVGAAIVEAFEAGATAGFLEVDRYGKITWRKTDIGKFAASLMQRAEDELAAAVERSVGSNVVATGDLRVTREAFKAGRRR